VEGSVERVERGRIGAALNQHPVQALQVSDGVDRASVLGDRSGLPSGGHCPGEVTVVCAGQREGRDAAAEVTAVTAG
jgi:hypothetical protein